MPQRSQPTERPHEHPSDSDKPESPSDSVATDAHKSLTFPLRWRLYSLVYFLVIGTSVAIFFGPLLVFTPFLLFVETFPGAWGRIPYYLVAGMFFLWFSARLVQDFRARVTFALLGINLHTPRYKPTLPWAIPHREHQTFTWGQIRHIEVLPDMVAVQFPTTAVVLHLTPQQHVQFMELTQACLPQTKVVMEAQVLQDFWSRPRGFSVWGSGGISTMIFYGSVGALVSLLIAAVFLEASRFFDPVFLAYLGGYLLVGVLRETTVRRRLVLTTNGIIEGSFPKPKMLGFAHNIPTFDFPGVLSRDKPVLVPWIPWSEITNFRRSDDDDAIVLESSQGELEIWGLAKRNEVKELIWQQIGTEHVAEEMSVYT